MKRIVSMCLVLLCFSHAWGQQSTTATDLSSVSVPPLINFSGMLTDLNGKPLTGMVGVTFLLYRDSQGGAPLWLETQNVQADRTGHYSVMLGSTTAHGVPPDTFSAGAAHWLGVQVQGQQEQPRVLLVSAPYAMKAADAQTLGGLPPSAFVLAAPPIASTYSSQAATTTSNGAVVPPHGAVTGLGTVNAIPLWDTTTDIVNSAMTQTGSGATARIGINTATPAATLDVKGAGTIRGALALPSVATATAAAGSNSQPLNLIASSFNSSTHAAVNQTFRLQSEPAGNNTASPSGTLNLLYAAGNNIATETGLSIAKNGLITFALGQTFPGTGTGSVTSVGLAAPASDFIVTGSPVTTSGTLNLAWNVAPTSTSTANAIVKRDATGSFSANSVLASYVQGVTSVAGQTGMLGEALATGTGSSVGVSGMSADDGFGVEGQNSSAGYGVYGTSTNGTGVFGNGLWGVQGQSNNQLGGGGQFKGFTASTGSGLSGSDGADVAGGNGDSISSTVGGNGIYSQAGSGGLADGIGGIFYGGLGSVNGDGMDVTAGSGWAGWFNGDVNVTGTLFSGTKDFKIDHPLDPANKYLVHTSVESSEMMNIYTGNVTTDAQGEATVHLPEWFEALNTDFRYQLTVIGQFAQAIVAREIQNQEFAIKTNAPNVKVSWLVTGVRQDAFAKARPLVVEEEKAEALRGFYIHPELHGAPPEKQLEWARHPALMNKVKAMREKAAVQHNAAGSVQTGKAADRQISLAVPQP